MNIIFILGLNFLAINNSKAQNVFHQYNIWWAFVNKVFN